MQMAYRVGDDLSENEYCHMDLSEQATERIIITLVVLAAVLLLRWLVVRVASRQVTDSIDHYRIRKSATYGSTLILFVSAGWIWSNAFGEVGTFLGLLTAGLAIALADVFLNAAGWIYIVSRHPFRAGDRIEIGEHSGDVVDIRVLRFTLMEIKNWVDADQPTGRLVHVPNRSLFSQAMANYTEAFDHIWHEVNVLITFESDRVLAEELVRSVLHNHHMSDEEMHTRSDFAAASKRYVIQPADFSPTVFLDVKDSGVQLTARLVIHPRERRQTNDRVWRDILEAFDAAPTVTLAYPTIRAIRD